MRKIAVVTGTRADYGYMRPVMKAIQEHPELELKVIASAMHFLEEFGNTFKDIEKDGFKIDAKVDIGPFEDTELSMSQTVGNGIIEFSKAINLLNPDIVLTLGDRMEQLAATIASAYMNTPVAHLSGGAKTEGGLDESARHAATKFAHIHLPFTKTSAQRIIKMGENPNNVYVVGATSLDTILNKKTLAKSELKKQFGFDFEKPVLLVLQHSISTEPEKAEDHMTATMEALKEVKLPAIVIYPNSDVGGRKMIKVIENYKLPFIKAYKSLDHLTYLSLMKHCAAMVGNSSSGILEAPSFKLPVVNIGRRQDGRERSTNIIDVDYNKEEIVAAIKKSLTPQFKKQVDECENPYGDGKAAQKITKILSTIKLDKSILKKQITY